MFFIDFIAGICVSVLAGLGVGGGGLLVIYLTMIKNIPQAESQGINLLFFVTAGTASLIIHIKKRKLNIKNMIVIITAGSLGAVSGSIIANFTNGATVKKFFGGFLIISGIIELFSNFNKFKLNKIIKSCFSRRTNSKV